MHFSADAARAIAITYILNNINIQVNLRLKQTVRTLSRLLPLEQSGQGPHCLPPVYVFVKMLATICSRRPKQTLSILWDEWINLGRILAILKIAANICC